MNEYLDKTRGKIIVFSAPSGSGKTTIINKLREDPDLKFSFSVSATNRQPRVNEQHGKDYYFLSDEQFRKNIESNNFIEYCEVYPGRFYGTLKSEIINKTNSGNNIVLDIDVEGAKNIKQQFGENSLLIFIKPPSIEDLEARLKGRGTDSDEVIKQRIARASYELGCGDSFDKVIVNHDLEKAVEECADAIREFIDNC